MTMGPGSSTPDTEALDEAQAAIESGRQKIEADREAALAAAQSSAQESAVNARFDALESKLDGLAQQVQASIASGTQATAQPADDIATRIESKLDQLLGGGSGQGAIGDDDDILSIEEIMDDAGEAVEGAGSAAAEAVEEVADKVPARGHALFRRRFGGGG